MKHKAFLLLGSNFGEREKHLSASRAQIRTEVGPLLSQSSLYKTEPWMMNSQDWFLNQVLCIETKLSPPELLQTILSIEMNLGRTRTNTDLYEDRTIDIDILYYENKIFEQVDLYIPHPRLHERKFTLIPLCEIAATFIHPKFGLTNQQLLNALIDTSVVTKL